MQNKNKIKIKKNFFKFLIVAFSLIIFFEIGFIYFNQNNKLNNNAITKSFLQTDSAKLPTTTLYRPLSLNLTTDTSKWNENKYPSQVSENNIKNLFVFNQQTSTTGTSTETASGFTFQKLSTKDNETTYTNITLENLKKTSELGLDLGNLTSSDFVSYGIEIINADDNAGTIDFKVFQSLSAYTKQINNTYINDTTNNDKFKNYRVLITPPTKYEQPDLVLSTSSKSEKTEKTIWRLPSTFKLKKAEFVFIWNSDSIINNFIKNYKSAPSTITKENAKNVFYLINLNFQAINNDTTIPEINPTFTPHDTTGQLDISITLPNGFIDSGKEFKKSFFGFVATGEDKGVKLITISNPLLTTAVIQQPLWDFGVDKNKVSYINKFVNTLSPSQFINVDPEKKYNYSLLDLFNNKKLNTPSTGDNVPLRISNSSSGEISSETKNKDESIGYLTFNGTKSGTGYLAKLEQFKITAINGFANDQTGVVDFLVHYQSLSNDGKIINAPPKLVQYTGFTKNIDSGQSIYFSWKENLPPAYANFSAKEIVNNFKAAASIPDNATANFSDNNLAKNFVSQFFNSSTYLKNKYNKPYNETTKAGAQVLVTEVVGANASDQMIPASVKVDIKFAQLGFETDKVFSKIFSPSPSNIIIPEALRAVIRVNQAYNNENHKFSNVFPSKLIFNQILNFFVFHIPNGGQQYTTPIQNATFFYIPNDRLGEIMISIIFPKFNNIQNFEFSAHFKYFNKNVLLTQSLELKHTPLIDLSAKFLAKNPLNPESLSVNDILDNVFKSANPIIFRLLNAKDLQIIQRGNDFVVFSINIDWNKLTQVSNPDSSLISNQVQKFYKHDNQINNQKLIFKISGFTGGKEFFNSNNQSSVVPSDVLDSTNIIIIGASLAAVLISMGFVILGFLVYYNKKYSKSNYFQPQINYDFKSKSKQKKKNKNETKMI